MTDTTALIKEARNMAGFHRWAVRFYTAKTLDRLADALEAAEARNAELAVELMFQDGMEPDAQYLAPILQRLTAAETQLKAIKDMVKSARAAGRKHPRGWSEADTAWTAFLDRILDGVDCEQETPDE